MKDWDYYQTPVGIDPFTYNDRNRYRKQLLDEINDEPLSAFVRNSRIKDLPNKVTAYAQERNRPYHAAVAALKEEFWTDCREELGYQKRLGPKAVATLEQKAWDDGHDLGYSEIFSKLEELVDFVNEMIDGLKTED